MNIYIYLLFLIHRLSNKSIQQVIDVTRKNKMNKENIKLFVRGYRVINKISKTPFLYKKYNLKCLRKALVLFYFSKKCGIKTTLKIGMHHYGRFLSGHAWVECEGKPFGDTSDMSRYKCILSEDNI